MQQTTGRDATSEWPAEISRFDLNERLVHWTTAILLLVVIATGTILYVPALMLDVGNRATVVNIHVICGLALVGPILVGLTGPWRRRLADDVHRLDRFRRGEWKYFRPRLAATVPGGKFNAGQKLFASLVAGGIVIMIATGVVMRWSPPFPNVWATGATFLHDIVYIVLFVLVIGHVAVALSRPDQLRSMFTGRISHSWARRHQPSWLDRTDLEGTAAQPEGEASQVL